MGLQLAPVSPHASFRDPSLQTQAARLVLGPESAFLEDRGAPDALPKGLLSQAATTALLWPPVETIWAYVVDSWRRLFDQRAGSGGGFELRTEMQLQLHLHRRFFEVATEGLTWSWTLLRAAFLFNLQKRMPIVMLIDPPEGPPMQLPPLDVRVFHGGAGVAFCPDAWFRDLEAAAPGSCVRLFQVEGDSSYRRLATEIASQLPRAGLHRANVTFEAPGSTVKALAGECPLALASAVGCCPASAAFTARQQLNSGVPVVATAHALPSLLDFVNELQACLKGQRLAFEFAGVNPFRSCLCAGTPAEAEAAPGAGRWGRLQGLGKRPELNGREVFLSEKIPSSGRWKVLLSTGEVLSVMPNNIKAQVEEPWPPVCTAAGELSSDELRRAARAQLLAEPFEERIAHMISQVPKGTNAFWVGLRLQGPTPAGE